MLKKKASRIELIREEGAEYVISPQVQARKETYRQHFQEFLEDPASRKIQHFPTGEQGCHVHASEVMFGLVHTKRGV